MPKRKIQPEAPIEQAVDTAEWFDCTVAALKLELGARGLSKAGRKDALIARLEAADNERPHRDELAPTPKRVKKAVLRGVEIKGPPASEVAQSQNVSSGGEKRLRPFESEPDETYKKKLKKVRNERMFMLDRNKLFDRDGYACERFDIAGSTGNIYQTTIGRKPSCTCMDARIRGQKCKHICYALIIILKAPAHLCYQTAFLSEELASIFANAPVTRAAEQGHDHEPSDQEEESTHAGNRKPIDGECPICVFDMEPNENIVWCKASCGQNFHKDCFDQWKRSKNGGRVTCVYCRAEWQEDGVSLSKKSISGSLSSLKESAPKIGSYRNIGNHAMYQKAK